MTNVMNVDTLYAIRDARGLDSNEKVFLFVVATRGCMFSNHKNAEADMGLKKDSYYRARKSLLKKDILIVRRRQDNTTVYEVDLGALLSHSANADSHSANSDSHSANDYSHQPETKVTMKETMKVNIEGNQTDASAPVDTDTSFAKRNPYQFKYRLKEPDLSSSLTKREAEPVYVLDLDIERTVADSHSANNCTVETKQYRPGMAVHHRTKPPETLEEQRAAFAAIVVKPRKKPEPDDDWW